MSVHGLKDQPEAAPSKFDKGQHPGEAIRAAASVPADKAWANAAHRERPQVPGHQRGGKP